MGLEPVISDSLVTKIMTGHGTFDLADWASAGIDFVSWKYCIETLINTWHPYFKD